MFKATELAVKNLSTYLTENKTTSSIRVFAQAGGCSGPSLALALDEKKSDDLVFENNGITFVVEESLMQQCIDITIYFVDAGNRSGFSITSSTPLPGSGCSSGSCGSHGCGH